MMQLETIKGARSVNGLRSSMYPVNLEDNLLTHVLISIGCFFVYKYFCTILIIYTII
jgi:hypothetical protein